jgi:hypothetical protein
MKMANQQKPDDFIAPARRAFRRVAQQLRVENARLGLPLIVGQDGHLKPVDQRADPTKACDQGDATGFIRVNALRLKVAARVHGKEK